LLFIGIQAGLMMWAVPRVGVIGAAYAFFGCYFLYFFSMSWVAHRLIGFRHSHTARHLIIRSVSLVVLAMAANRLLPEWPSALVGVCIAAIGGLWCLRGLIDRLGTRQRVIQLLLRIPGLARILGVRNAA
ncbi:MAG: polysaccharide biosynthesis C-terminal domain-containing protein, partial [Dokdonella sp.]